MLFGFGNCKKAALEKKIFFGWLLADAILFK